MPHNLHSTVAPNRLSPSLLYAPNQTCSSPSQIGQAWISPGSASEAINLSRSSSISFSSSMLFDLSRYSQHRDKMRGRGEHDEDMPHFMKSEYAGDKIEDLCNVYNRAQ